MAIRKIKSLMSTIELVIEDVMLVLVSIFVVVLAAVALLVLATPSPELTIERALAIAQLGFLGKAEYFAALLLPWMLILIGILVARELWFIRRRLESLHIDFVMQRTKKKR